MVVWQAATVYLAIVQYSQVTVVTGYIAAYATIQWYVFVETLCFGEWETGNDLWDAMNRLWFPYKGDWGCSELKDGVEFYQKPNIK